MVGFYGVRRNVYGQILKLFRLHEALTEWRNKCYENKYYFTPPDTNVIDFETLYDELMLHACH